ncbi:MAG: S8 family serine peptidase [Gammaproteobacteria bacterium]|nr:S8 family serine peptidase [Gammaproteobacteria bacterium]
MLAGIMSSMTVSAESLERFVVTYKAGETEQAMSAIAQADGKFEVDLSEINAVAVSLPAQATAALARNPVIEFVETDPTRSIMRIPGITAADKLTDSGETIPYGIPMVQADQVSYNPDNHRTLCIVDSGYDINHEDLQKDNVTGTNFSHSGTWDSDEASHGTHVAGTAVALGGNGIGVVGVASSGDMPIYIAKVFDASGSAPGSIIARAVLACEDAGANVISMSLGGSKATKFEQRVYDSVAANNILIVAAAGNGGNNSISYPAGFSGVMSVAAVDSGMNVAAFSQYNSDVEIAAPGVGVLSTVPAGSQETASLSVDTTTYNVHPMEGSPHIDASGPLADFGLGDVVMRKAMTGKVCLIQRGSITFADKVKNCQKSGGIGAVIYNHSPGELFGTLAGTKTRIPSVGATLADGESMLTQLGTTANVAVFNSTDLYAAYSGTSMSTPHVSSAAALVWSNHPECSAAQIRDALNNSAMDLGAAGRDDYYGNGLLQVHNAIDFLSENPCN